MEAAIMPQNSHYFIGLQYHKNKVIIHIVYMIKDNAQYFLALGMSHEIGLSIS